MKTSHLLTLSYLLATATAWSQHRPAALQRSVAHAERYTTTRLPVLGDFFSETESTAKAISVTSADYNRAAQQRQEDDASSSSGSFLGFWGPVVSSAMMITGNTFGAGSLVLPDLTAAPGLGPSIGIFGVAYALNLISGLTLANVAINQYESARDAKGSAAEVPSSFQEFVQANLQSPQLAMLISAVCFGVNSLVLAFDISRVGILFEGAAGMDPMAANVAWSVALAGLVATQTTARMSQAASLCVMILFASFGSLLLPGLASLSNPMADLWTPGTAALEGTFWSSVTDIAPVILMCTIFQNIVPTIVKLQEYNRTKSTSAIVLGSSLPVLMYIAWCWACLGEGGIDLAATMSMASSPFLTIFSLATLAGSSIGCSLSCASELDIFVKKTFAAADDDKQTLLQDEIDEPQDAQNERFQLVSVLATVGLPLGVNAAFGGADLTSALHVAGGLGSPLLYGIIPALMAYKQIQKSQAHNNKDSSLGKAGMGVFGAASTGMLCGSLMEHVTAMLPTFSTAAAVAEAVAM